MDIQLFEFNMLPVNTYVVSDRESRKAAVIDAGCYFKNECETLKQYIEKNRLEVTLLLNTHLHFDHIFGNRFMYEEYGLKTCAHKDDEEWLMNAPQRTRLFGLEFPGSPVPIGKYLEEGDTLAIGKYTLQCIGVPGHSPGSVVFYSQEAGCIFSGDALFKGSVGRSDLPGGNHQVLINSIRDKLLTLPEETIVYPGHGPQTTIGYEKTWNFYLKD